MSEFIFDVDGTLTPSRGTIDPEFKEFFMAFAKKNNVYLVTGSDRPKTCLLYTSPSPRDRQKSRMPSSA